MYDETRYTVIGAGHGGKAMATDLAARGFAVTLYNRTPERISEIAARGAIELEYENGVSRSHCLEPGTPTRRIVELRSNVGAPGRLSSEYTVLSRSLAAPWPACRVPGRQTWPGASSLSSTLRLRGRSGE
jgi:choline dehydrogenase-like flavoprotein